MNLLDNFAHGLLVIVAAFARFTLGILETVEGWLRQLMHGAGLSVDMQTVILLFILVMFLVGVLRLLGGRIRLAIALILILILAHTIGGLASGPLGGG